MKKNLTKAVGPTNLLLLLCALVASLIAAEIGVRISPKPKLGPLRQHDGDPAFAYDTLLGWKPRPWARYRRASTEYEIEVRHNALLRGPERNLSLTGDGCRILIVGDSFVHGLTVRDDDMIDRIVEAELRRRVDSNCAVISAGVEGYSTDQEYLFFVRDLAALRPSTTVLVFFYNDILCNVRAVCNGSTPKPLFEDIDGVLALTNVPVPRSPYRGEAPPSVADPAPVAPVLPADAGGALAFRRWLNERSQLYGLVRRTIKYGEASGVRSFWSLGFLPEELDVYRRDYSPEVAVGWDRTEQLLAAFAAAASKVDSDFVIFLAPMRESVERSQWQRMASTFHLSESEWNPDQVEHHLGRICADHQWTCVLPSERFRQFADSKRGSPYLKRDLHWSEVGHKLAGQILAEALVRKRRP